METILLIAVVNILIFYFLWFFGYRQYFIHSFRHELFKIRDQLFKYAELGNISFDNKAFLDRWLEINSMIRFANQTHTILFSSIMMKKKNSVKTKEWTKQREKNLRALTHDQQKFLDDNYSKQLNLFGIYLIKSSFVLLGISLVYFSVIFITIVTKERIDRRKKIKLQLQEKIEPVYSNYYEASLAIS